MPAELPELGLADGDMPDVEDEEVSEAMTALEEAMPKAKPAERAAMKRAMEACVAEFMAKGEEY
jgi:hypothetical protein